MKRTTFIGILFPLYASLCFNSELFAQEIHSDLYVYTIGNFADLSSNSPAIKALSEQIENEKVTSAIIFTGDISKVNLLNDIERAKDSIRINFLIKQLQS